MITEEVKIQTGESTRTVKDLRKELKDLKDQLLNTQQGTEEYSETMRKAANIQKELKDQMMEVNNSAMDFGQKVGNVTKAMTGVSGAITAATGALSLFGVENEEAQKKITATMTSLIGITQGLSKIDDGVKAFKRLTIAVGASSKSLNIFKTALISTGIGALVVVLGSVIAYWDEFTEAIGLSSEKMEHLGDVAKGVFNVITSSLKGIAQALGKMLKGDFKGAWDSLKNGFSVVKNFNEGVAKSQAKREEEQTKKAKEEADKRAKIAEEEYKKRIQAAEKLAKYEKDMAQAKLRGDDAEKYSEEQRKIQERYFDTLFALYKKDSEEYKNLVLEKEQWLQDWENHFMEEARNEEKKKQEQEEKDRQRYEDQKKRDEEEKLRRHQNNVDRLQDFYDSLQTEIELLDEWYNEVINAAIAEGRDTTLIYKKWAEEREKLELQEKYAKIAMYSSMAGIVGNILVSISDMEKEGSEQQKNLAIAGATINTIAGAIGAYAQAAASIPPPYGLILGALNAAAVTAAGIAQIQKIKQVRPDGSGDISSAPSVSVPMVINASPDFSQSVDGAMTQTSIRNQKVYVLEHDITETQNKVEVAEARASY